MKHAILSILMLLAAVSARADIPFAVDWRLDAPLLAAGATETALSLALPKLLDYGDLPMEKGDLDTVNALDRWAAHGYVKAWDRAGDAAVALSLVLPAAVYGGIWLGGGIETADAAKVAVMYAEGFLLTQGTCGLIKLAAKRDRPFMYYDEWDTSGATDGDAHYSFPSSHTADAFMSAAFLTYTFAKIWPDSPWRIPVAAGGWTLAAARRSGRSSGWRCRSSTRSSAAKARVRAALRSRSSPRGSPSARKSDGFRMEVKPTRRLGKSRDFPRRLHKHPVDFARRDRIPAGFAVRAKI